MILDKIVTDRFWFKVRKTDTCWLWLGAKGPTGYGHVNIYGEHTYAHRVSFILHKGLIPKGLEVCHSCDVKNCVNPEHLYAGTHEQNIQDAVVRVKLNQGELNGGSKLDVSDIQEIKDLLREKVGQYEIASMFQVSQTQISRIARNVNWKR